MSKTKLSTIIKRNAAFQFKNREPPPVGRIVYVFTGAMSGIGAKMLEKMMMISYHHTVFYVLWQSDPAINYRKRLFNALLHRTCKIIYIEVDLSLISDMDAASQQIMAEEENVDYICMSKNDNPIDEDKNTSEDVDATMSTWYFARMRLVSNLLPLLRQSSKPRVLNILNYGLHLPSTKEYGGHPGIFHYTNAMTNLVFDHLATENRRITFVLSPIGFDTIEGPQHPDAFKAMGVFRKAWRTALTMSIDVSERFFGMRPNEVVERHICYLASATCEPGTFRVDEEGEIVSATLPVRSFWEEGQNQARDAWEHAEKLWQTALARKVAN